MTNSLRTYLLSTLLALLVASAAEAQTRSDTGRHQPPPPPPEESDTEPEETGRSGWVVGALAGVQGGSDLFQVKVLDGTVLPWETIAGTGFHSSRFSTSLDTNLGMGLFVARDFGHHWRIRADFGWSKMDVAAEALQGQSGAVFLYDRFMVVTGGIGVEAALTKGRSHPFVSGQLALVKLSPDAKLELKQTQLGARLGLGWVQAVGDTWSARAEARLVRTGFTIGDFQPTDSLPGDTEYEMTVEDRLYLFEIFLGLEIEL